MTIFKLKLILFMLYITNSALIDAQSSEDYVCKTNVTDISTHKSIENLSEYCEKIDKSCVPKCCGRYEMFFRKKNKRIKMACTNWTELGVSESNYTSLFVYHESMENIMTKTEKKFFDDFHVVQNSMQDNKECAIRLEQSQHIPYLLENGSLAKYVKNFEKWSINEPERFCVDLILIEDINHTRTMRTIFIVGLETGGDEEKTYIFLGIASAISSVFLALVLLVYCLLPRLRNFSGKLFMAYMAALFFTFLIKAVLTFFSTNIPCEIIDVINYFYYFSSFSAFFWLNVISYDVWWTFRGCMFKRTDDPNEEKVLLRWYSLYGLGAPLGVTIVVIIINNTSSESAPYLCSTMGKFTRNYVIISSGVLLTINVLLYIATIWNIWVTKNKLNEFRCSDRSKINKFRLSLYMKMSTLMGITWFLELFSLLCEDILWLYIIVNLYNILMGVVIFITFVLNRKSLQMFCKRFNITNRFFNEDTARKSNAKSSLTKSTTCASSSANNNTNYQTTNT